MALWREWVARWGGRVGGVIFLGGVIAGAAIPEGVTIAFLGAVIGLGSIVVGGKGGPEIFARKVVCHRCGWRQMMIGVELRHCSQCGAPYLPPGE
jgi:hypothetical protein